MYRTEIYEKKHDEALLFGYRKETDRVPDRQDQLGLI